jgi:hypothetical protein
MTGAGVRFAWMPLNEVVGAEETMDDFDRKSSSLTADFIEAALGDASILEGIPRGAVLVLLPEDDPAFVEESIALGIAAVQQGRDVVFRHTARSTKRAEPT